MNRLLYALEKFLSQLQRNQLELPPLLRMIGSRFQFDVLPQWLDLTDIEHRNELGKGNV